MTFALIFHADTRNKFPTSNSKISSAKWGKTQFVTFKQKRTTAKRHVLLHAYELYADGCCCCCWLLDIPRIRRHLFLFGISNELHWHWRHCDTTFNSLPPPLPFPTCRDRRCRQRASKTASHMAFVPPAPHSLSISAAFPNSSSHSLSLFLSLYWVQ